MWNYENALPPKPNDICNRFVRIPGDYCGWYVSSRECWIWLFIG